MQFEIDFTQQDGLWVFQETLAKMQGSYKDSITALVSIFGDKTILTGCEVSGTNITSGWIISGGELLPFVGGTAKARVVLNTVTGTEFFDDGSQKPIYTSKSLVLADAGGFAFSDLKRAIPYQNLWCKGDIKDVVCDANYIATNFDSSGLGKNERLGWAIMNGQNGTLDAGGRVTVGYSAITINPGDNVWDYIYNTVGSMAGEKMHTLSIQEMPSHDHGLPNNWNEDGAGHIASGGRVDEGAISDRTAKTGGGQSHENRQPFIVTLKIIKL